ncbi:MAG: hypothetical protein Q8O56_06225 [Solirubrobacteraceae bacterium]|nr:hypothetical protein [Solirubrobacteraceae bacterium]
MTIVKRLLQGAPAGLAITAQLADGDETLDIPVIAEPVLDAEGDALDAYRATFVLPASIALPIQLRWLQDADTPSEAIVGSEIVSQASQTTDTVALATLHDLATRLGKQPAGLTAEQAAQGELLLALATGVIADAAGKPVDWAATLDPVPAILRAVCVELAARVMSNPAGARSSSEQLGLYRHSESFAAEHGVTLGLLLTNTERQLVRRAANGRMFATTMPRTTVDQIIELGETGEITSGVTDA